MESRGVDAHAEAHSDMSEAAPGSLTGACCAVGVWIANSLGGRLKLCDERGDVRFRQFRQVPIRGDGHCNGHRHGRWYCGCRALATFADHCTCRSNTTHAHTHTHTHVQRTHVFRTSPMPLPVVSMHLIGGGALKPNHTCCSHKHVRTRKRPKKRIAARARLQPQSCASRTRAPWPTHFLFSMAWQVTVTLKENRVRAEAPSRCNTAPCSDPQVPAGHGEGACVHIWWGGQQSTASAQYYLSRLL